MDISENELKIGDFAFIEKEKYMAAPSRLVKIIGCEIDNILLVEWVGTNSKQSRYGKYRNENLIKTTYDEAILYLLEK